MLLNVATKLFIDDFFELVYYHKLDAVRVNMNHAPFGFAPSQMADWMPVTAQIFNCGAG